MGWDSSASPAPAALAGNSRSSSSLRAGEALRRPGQIHIPLSRSCSVPVGVGLASPLWVVSKWLDAVVTSTVWFQCLSPVPGNLVLIAEETDGLGPFPSFRCRIGGLEKGQVASLRTVLVGAEPGWGLVSWLWMACSPHTALCTSMNLTAGFFVADSAWATKGWGKAVK